MIKIVQIKKIKLSLEGVQYLHMSVCARESTHTHTHHSALYTFLPLFKKKKDTGVGDLSPRLGLSAASCANKNERDTVLA